MMQDPNFVNQMKQFTERPGFKEAAAKVKDQFDTLSRDPEKMQAMTNEFEAMLEGAKDDSAEGLRRRARNMAAQEMSGNGPAQVSGSEQAMLGLEALKAANKDPKLMAEAMEQMKNPAIMQEVRNLMRDPAFADQIKNFAGTAEFKQTIEQSAEIMKDMYN